MSAPDLHAVNRELAVALLTPNPPYDPEVHSMSESEHNALVAKKRRIFLTLVQELKDRWAEYVEEAEHQDGLEYWDKFETHQDGVEDFRLYHDLLDRVDG